MVWRLCQMAKSPNHTKTINSALRPILLANVNATPHKKKGTMSDSDSSLVDRYARDDGR